MKKLHLNIDALLVESFATHAGTRDAGTVRAHQFGTETNGGSCFSDLCFPTDWCGDTNMCASANATCAGMCGNEN
jgi:hypothetical protein